MVGSRLDDLAECNPTATAFPGGSLYVSAGTTRAVHDGAGELGEAQCFPSKDPLPHAPPPATAAGAPPRREQEWGCQFLRIACAHTYANTFVCAGMHRHSWPAEKTCSSRVRYGNVGSMALQDG